MKLQGKPIGASEIPRNRMPGSKVQRRASQKNAGRILLVSLCLLLLFSLFGCGSASETEQGLVVYMLNKEGTTLVPVPYEGAEDQLLEEMLLQLGAFPERIELKAPLQMNISLLRYEQEGNQLHLYMDEAYKQLSPTDEILVRAALVKTLTQIPDIEYVDLFVCEEPLMTRAGTPVGLMRGDSFVDNEGSEINAKETTMIRLYYANESGTMLQETQRKVEYSSNISLEKVVLEQLIAGADPSEGYATINPQTKINSVTVADGVCYVDFNNAFLQQVYNVSPEVLLYSVVNSLSELNNINKVRISIDGNSDLVFRDKFPLNTVFERNLDLLEP